MSECRRCKYCQQLCVSVVISLHTPVPCMYSSSTLQVTAFLFIAHKIKQRSSTAKLIKKRTVGGELVITFIVQKSDDSDDVSNRRRELLARLSKLSLDSYIVLPSSPSNKCIDNALLFVKIKQKTTCKESTSVLS